MLMGLENVRLEFKDIGAGDLTLGDWLVLQTMKLGRLRKESSRHMLSSGDTMQGTFIDF